MTSCKTTDDVTLKNMPFLRHFLFFKNYMLCTMQKHKHLRAKE